MRANEIAPIECAGAGPRRVIIMSAEYSEIVVWPVIATSLYIGCHSSNIGHIFLPFYPPRDVQTLEPRVQCWPNICQDLANVCLGFVNESRTQPTGMRSDTRVVTVKYDLMKTLRQI